jgi:4-nitrophenyl phosphatase
MRSVNEARGLLIDMDGVLWRGGSLLPGVQEFFVALRDLKIPFLLVTNNATVSPESVVERLSSTQVEIKPEEVLTSALATAAYLQTVLPTGANVFPIGEAPVRAALRAAGFNLLEQHDSAQAVVMGFDREINLEKMTQAALAIQTGALFVGTNPDVSFPIEEGQAPGNGAFIRAIEATTSVSPVIVGKPEPLLFEQAVERLAIPSGKTLMVGDRLETDILGAQRAGISTALMLTGVTSIENVDASEIQPDFIYKDLKVFTAELKAGRA